MTIPFNRIDLKDLSTLNSRKAGLQGFKKAVKALFIRV
jgi:hypothetical protein